jgi:hypothetical protein
MKPFSPTATEVAARHHRRATRFFWSWLIGATLMSLAGNVTEMQTTGLLGGALGGIHGALLFFAV